MKSFKLDVKYKEKASRWELAMRLVYWIPLVIVLWILSILAAVCWVIQLLVVLFAGKRNKTLQKIILARVRYRAKFAAYYGFLTDERPEIVPEEF
ncbi:DUF4389 domain-containing protein [Candidatus Micrarchaeota archaeon CG_4_10_14_0_2_um_filter_55_9]|nr:MAG: hypothetical protein AUJ15_03625 [Candidatus Micrarchaeota archaeon CG1_02_55_41]PIZ91766.1 MAG: DUF4389 domain-containing protein [Candidatus Micrarchaeota archaeon CG_4_10_14_0_2_um_filter_55_9]PJD01457.1 MAG: DUF4389 domain-containing protein [Candidatus Micrarchaeota archaeon CG10_big_fil_rev_8_21_14_0_10_54_18]